MSRPLVISVKDENGDWETLTVRELWVSTPAVLVEGNGVLIIHGQEASDARTEGQDPGSHGGRPGPGS